MRMHISSSLAALTLLAPGAAMAHHAGVGSTTEHAGPINTVSPATLEEGYWALEVRIQIVDFNSFSDQFLEDVALSGIEDVHNTDSFIVPSLSLSYGISDRLEISLAIPYFVRNGIREAEAVDGEAGLDVLGNSNGIGDLVAFGKYRFLDGQYGGVNAAVLAGLQMPTGKTSELDDSGVPFEAEFQPGSGAWSPMAGLSVGRFFGPAAIDANVLYVFSGRGTQDTDLGNRLSFNAAFSYRLGSGEHHHDEEEEVGEHGHACWSAVLELNGEWQKREQTGDEFNIHSGGTQLFVSPGLHYNSARDWGAYLSVGVPVYQDLNGIQNEVDIRGSAGFGFTF